MHNLRILIVDDNLALARVTQFAFEGAGWQTRTAANGRIALQLADASQFDVVVTDHQMPEMSGVELCRELRSRPAYAECPILLLTAKGLELELPALREELGINEIFPKPFSPSAVVKAAEQLTVAST